MTQIYGALEKKRARQDYHAPHDDPQGELHFYLTYGALEMKRTRQDYHAPRDDP